MKKTVRVLIVEPKPSILDLIKDAVATKPDPYYEYEVVATANTAKAAYFVMYKHHPHILFLNPDLPDETGESFIENALERMPYLKIIGMSSMFREEEMLKAGAHAFISIPIQKTYIWRKLDEIVADLDAIGLLEVKREEDVVVVDDTVELFEFEDPEESPEYNPIFEDLLKKGESTPAPTKRVEPVIMDDDVVLVSLGGEDAEPDSPREDVSDHGVEPGSFESEEGKPAGSDAPIMKQKTDPPDTTTQPETDLVVETGDEEDPLDLLVSNGKEGDDPQDHEPKEESETPAVHDDLLSLFDFGVEDRERKEVPKKAKQKVGDEMVDEDWLAPFRFNEASGNHEGESFPHDPSSGKTDAETPEEDPNPIEDLESRMGTEALGLGEDRDNVGPEKTGVTRVPEEPSPEPDVVGNPAGGAGTRDGDRLDARHAEDVSERAPTPSEKAEDAAQGEPSLFTFEGDGGDEIQDERAPRNKRRIKTPEDVPESLQEDLTPLPSGFTFRGKKKASGGEEKRKPTPLFELDADGERISPARKVEPPLKPMIQESSNTTKQGNQLYPGAIEYNKTKFPKRAFYESGYYNRYNEFVPLYPPREHFPTVATDPFSRMARKKEESDGGSSSTGSLSIFKKLFHRKN